MGCGRYGGLGRGTTRRIEGAGANTRASNTAARSSAGVGIGGAGMGVLLQGSHGRTGGAEAAGCSRPRARWVYR